MKDEPAVGPPLIGALLRMPVDAIYARMLAGMHEAGFTDIVAAHLAVLRYPGPDGRRPTELAETAGMSKQAMNYLLGQLEQLGYLTREADPDDRRSTRVRLTKRGHALVPCIRGTVAAVEAELEHELGVREFAQLRRSLERLNATAFVGGG